MENNGGREESQHKSGVHHSGVQRSTLCSIAAKSGSGSRLGPLRERMREREKQRISLGGINLRRATRTDSRLFPFSETPTKSRSEIRPRNVNDLANSRASHYLGWSFSKSYYRATCHDRVTISHFVTSRTCQWKQTESLSPPPLVILWSRVITTAEPGRPFRTYDAGSRCAINVQSCL